MRLRAARLEAAIRPVGYFRQKAKRLRGFTRWLLSRYHGRPGEMFRRPWRALRRELLELDGIGPETADSMLLYAGGRPVFVVDAYTRRVFARHYVTSPRAGYEEIQATTMRRLGRQARLYNEFHALLVAVGKSYCHRRDPDCGHCPLEELPHSRRVLVDGSW
jgi:endonuclease-3 related protein